MSDAETIAIIDATIADLMRRRAELEGKSVVNCGFDPVADLRRRCLELRIAVVGDMVAEADAARLLCKAPMTLRNWRYDGDPLRSTKIGRGIFYRLAALAMYRNRYLTALE